MNFLKFLKCLLNGKHTNVEILKLPKKEYTKFAVNKRKDENMQDEYFIAKAVGHCKACNHWWVI